MTRRYEVLFVVRPDIGEAGVKDEIERARRILEQHDATTIQVHDWGLRDLAYRIETYHRGSYVLIEYDGTPRAVSELERALKLSEQVLRFMSVRQSEGAGQILNGEQPISEEVPDDVLAGEEEILLEAEEGEV